MAGLFGWLNGKKNADASTNGKPSEAYFLDADSAKTFGDIDYMRTAKVVRRTFPKTASSPEEFERVDSVSAMGKMTVNGKLSGAAQEPMQNGSSSNGASPEVVSERRRADTSMDMFRSMAKDMRKR